MSRVKSIQELYLWNARGDHTFYHATPLKSPSLGQLQSELQRLECHKFETEDHQLLKRLRGKTGVILNLNIQSLSAHLEDLTTDSVFMKASELCLTETRMSTESPIEISGYQLVAQNKRSKRAGGVALYVKKRMLSVGSVNPGEQPTLSDADCGDLCVGEFMFGGKCYEIVTIYVNPGTTLAQLKIFLKRNRNILVPKALSKKSMPLIVCGDFNHNLRVGDIRQALLTFMEEQFNLVLANDPNQATTHNQSCIDLVFTRNIDHVECALSESYFSFHKPILLVWMLILL